MGLLKVDRQHQVGEWAFQNNGGAISGYDFGTIIPGFCLMDQAVATIKEPLASAGGLATIQFGTVFKTFGTLVFIPITPVILANTLLVGDSVLLLATQPNNLIYFLNVPNALFSMGMAIGVEPLTSGRIVTNLGYNRTDL